MAGEHRGETDLCQEGEREKKEENAAVYGEGIAQKNCLFIA